MRDRLFWVYSLFAACALLLSGHVGYAQVFEEESSSLEAIPYQLVEQKPVFSGANGMDFSAWVKNHLIYPASCANQKIQGRVVVSMIITDLGWVRQAKVIKGVHPDLDAEALRVINQSPQWTPGKQGDAPVSVMYTFPVSFLLR